MKLRPLHLLALLFTLLPMVIGSAIFWTWYINPKWGDLPIYGIVLLFIGTPLCFLSILFELIVLYRNKGNKSASSRILKTIILTLLNIPLALFYLWFGDILYNSNRITLINTTGTPVEAITVFGAGDLKTINHLDANGRKTIWYRIRKGGSLQINYTLNGSKKEKTIDSYVCVGGEKYDYLIRP
ncbi:MAG: hypothetical protein ACHQRM_07435 [Bacteroidia bacterium]